MDEQDPTREIQREIADLERQMRVDAEFLDPAEIAAYEERIFELQGNVDEVLTTVSEKTQDASGWARDMGFEFSSAFEKAVLGGEQLSEVLKGLLRDIAQIVIRSAITAPLGAAIGQGIGNVIPFGGTRATGGPVRPDNAYLVGEKGPEFFIPTAAGKVATGMGGGGVAVDINIHNAPPGTTAAASNGADGRKMIDLVLGEVNNSIAGGGSVASTLQTTYGLNRNRVTRT